MNSVGQESPSEPPPHHPGTLAGVFPVPARPCHLTPSAAPGTIRGTQGLLGRGCPNGALRRSTSVGFRD